MGFLETDIQHVRRRMGALPAVAPATDKSFSEQVGAEKRIALKQQISRRWARTRSSTFVSTVLTTGEKDTAQTAVVFHPKAIEMVNFQPEFLTAGKNIADAVAAKRCKMDQESQVLVALQRLRSNLRHLTVPGPCSLI